MHKRAGSVVLLLASGLLPAPSCSEATAPPPAAPEVLVAEVVARDVPLSREWIGETRGRADIEIRARVEGFLREIHFREGSRVRKGQILYSIDPSELQQAEVAAAATLAESKTLLANAEADVRRYEPLATIHAVSQRDLENAVARRDAAISQVEASEANLRLARIELSYAEVRSPIDGLIGLTQVKVGDYLAPFSGTVLNTVSDIDPIHVRFAITEREYLELARRYPLGSREDAEEKRKAVLELILADGSVHPHAGQVHTVDRSVQASTGTLTVEAAFPNPDGILLPGLYGKVRAVVDEIPGALLVPQRAVQELQGQYQVWVVEDGGMAHPRFVQPGARVDSLWVITEGLERGDRVVAEGFQRLRPGMAVVAKPYEPPPAADATAAS